MSTGGQRWRDKDLNARARACQDGEQTHIRLGPSWLRDDHAIPGEEIILVGHARDLHGPDGACTCCPRRST